MVRISEITGIEDGRYQIEDVFGFKQVGVDDSDKAVGEFYATGYRPACIERMAAAGIAVSEDIFRSHTL